MSLDRFLRKPDACSGRVWIRSAAQDARSLGRPATLDDISDVEFDRLTAMGFDWIWFLSSWRTGPAAQQISRAMRHSC
jgi:hypothetical protein